MSALARYFVAKGYRVLGYDRTESPLTHQLEAEGIGVQYDDVLDIVKTLDVATTIVVRTPAVPEDTPIYTYIREIKRRIKKSVFFVNSFYRKITALLHLKARFLLLRLNRNTLPLLSF